MNIKKLTDYKWLNLFNATKILKDGSPLNWVFASRKKEQTLEEKEKPDAVVIIPIMKERTDTSLGYYDEYSLVIINEYRIPIMDYEIGFPAGLIDGEENPEEAAKRELKEETGLDLVKVIHVSPVVYSSAGMTDESVVYVFCEVEGTISTENNEKSEDITVIKLNKKALSKLGNLGKIGAKAYPIMLMAKIFGIQSLLSLK